MPILHRLEREPSMARTVYVDQPLAFIRHVRPWDVYRYFPVLATTVARQYSIKLYVACETSDSMVIRFDFNS